MVGLPLILFQVGGKKKLSDTEFMAIKTFEGKMIKNAFEINVPSTTTTIVATIIPANGKTFYHYKTNQIIIDVIINDSFISRLLNNGVFVDAIGGNTSSSVISPLFTNYTTVSDSMIGNGSIAYTLESFTDESVSVNTKGILQGWIEDTGESPAI